jgi:hypothetical protein
MYQLLRKWRLVEVLSLLTAQPSSPMFQLDTKYSFVESLSPLNAQNILRCISFKGSSAMWKVCIL